MSANTNLVAKWALNIKQDAEAATRYVGTDNKRAVGCIGEIIGACEAIIAATNCSSGYNDADTEQTHVPYSMRSLAEYIQVKG